MIDLRACQAGAAGRIPTALLQEVRAPLCASTALGHGLSMVSVQPEVPHREELIFLLSEAAEIEHCLMCCYLYAGFSLKRPSDASLTEAEAAAVGRWRSSIHAVAVEEMLHLALVQNLLASIGAAPHLQRPNFPIAPGIFPSGIVVELRRFDLDTLDHFVFLERPEGLSLSDGEGFEPEIQYARPDRNNRLMASAQDYATVGALYHGIEHGFEDLAQTLGEGGLFVGDPRAQVDGSLLKMEGLCAIADLATAQRAIERIIEQGEGARRSHEISHYERFDRIRKEFVALKKERQGFEPAHPVVANPVMNKPPEPKGRAFIDEPESARLLDLANASYGLMVQCLAGFFGRVDEAGSRRVLVDVAMSLMGGAVGPLAEALVTSPASTALPGETAGLSFALPRTVHALPQRVAGWTLLIERAKQLASAAATNGRTASVAECLAGVVKKLETQGAACRE